MNWWSVAAIATNSGRDHCSGQTLRRALHQMRRMPICVALGVLSAFAGSGIVPIRLYYEFQQQPPSVVLDSIQEELHRIMVPLGLNFEWRSLAVDPRNEVSADLAIIRFKGQCDVNDLQPTRSAPGRLGWAYMENGEVLSFIAIDCDQLRGLLQPELRQMHERARASAYGAATARVLAHELYHVLLKTASHDSSGVAKRSFTIQDLLCPGFRFNKKENQALQAYSTWLATVDSDLAISIDH